MSRSLVDVCIRRADLPKHFHEFQHPSGRERKELLRQRKNSMLSTQTSEISLYAFPLIAVLS